LQALIKDLESHAPAVIDDVFHQHASELRAAVSGPIPDGLAWARSIQNPVTHVLSEPWRGLFKTLGRTQECRAAQGRGAGARFQRGLAMCDTYGLWSERAAALMFDVVVQNGSISAVVDQQIRADIAALGSLSPHELEVRKMEIVAIRRSAVSRPEWVADVRARKLTIARGTGSVHGRDFELDQDYGIRLVDRRGVLADQGLSGPSQRVGVS